MSNPLNSNQKGIVEVVVIAVFIMIAAIVFFVWQRVSDDSSSEIGQESSEVAEEKDESQLRDEVRQQHAIKLANSLFSKQLFDDSVPRNQQILDELQDKGTDEELKDPLTNKSYVFRANQKNMEVGEVTYNFGSTCDNKLVGSTGDGLIEELPSSAIALAIKLEAEGKFACQSSL